MEESHVDEPVSPESREPAAVPSCTGDVVRKSIAAAIGNWNDRHSNHDGLHDASLRWIVIDRIVSWFYRRGF